MNYKVNKKLGFRPMLPNDLDDLHAEVNLLIAPSDDRNYKVYHGDEYFDGFYDHLNINVLKSKLLQSMLLFDIIE